MPTPDLYPIPFTSLVARLERELDRGESVYFVPRRDWWTPDPERDVSIVHHGHRLATPAGPASGPHTQLAQNLVAAWLTGSRFMELKTVQVNDELEIPRPCIYAPHVCYNVEWSQELRVPQSGLEYVKGWMLVHYLASAAGLWPGVEARWDLSLGYDLAGLRSEKVRNYVDQMRDASSLIAGLRAELPASLAKWADIEVPAAMCDSVTLSTFHGCPASEIEAIARETLEWGLHTVIKLNPTLMGYDRVRGILDSAGYDFITLRRDDFDKDLQWAQLMDMLPRLRKLAADKGLGFGVKLSNTLVHTSPEPPFEQQEMYLSGPPLHMISFQLAAEVRDATDPTMPMTFSAGVDQKNFDECVAAGLGPVTACTDLLKAKGYARQTKYLRALEKRMKTEDVTTVPALRRALGGHDDPAVAAAAYLSGRAGGIDDDVRYSRAKNAKAPNKVGTELALLDCLTCDKCIPVCPNLANFAVHVPPGTHRPGRVSWQGGAFTLADGAELVIAKPHQIGNTIDSCNLCGNCDTWCPEDGGPYIVKPSLFLSEESFADHPGRDGFLVTPDHRGIRWRRGSEMLSYDRNDDGTATLAIEGGTVVLRDDAPVSATGAGEVDLTDAVTLRLYLDALTDPNAETWLAPA